MYDEPLSYLQVEGDVLVYDGYPGERLKVDLAEFINYLSSLTIDVPAAKAPILSAYYYYHIVDDDDENFYDAYDELQFNISNGNYEDVFKNTDRGESEELLGFPIPDENGNPPDIVIYDAFYNDYVLDLKWNGNHYAVDSSDFEIELTKIPQLIKILAAITRF